MKRWDFLFRVVFVCAWLAGLSSCADAPNPLTVLPANAPVILELNQSPAWFHQRAQSWKAQSTLFYQRFDELIRTGKKWYARESVVAKVFNEQPMFIAIFPGNAETKMELLATQSAENLSDEDLENLLLKWKTETDVHRSNFRGAKIFQVSGAGLSYSFCLKNGILLSATSPIVIERAVTAVSRKETLHTDKNFLSLRELLINKQDLAVYYQPDEWNKLLRNLGNPGMESSWSADFLKTGWRAASLQLDANGFQFKGFTRTDSRTEEKWQTLNREVLESMIPSDAAAISGSGVATYEALAANCPPALKAYLPLLKQAQFSQVAEFLINPLQENMDAYRCWGISARNLNEVRTFLESEIVVADSMPIDSIPALSIRKSTKLPLLLQTAGIATAHSELYYATWQQFLFYAANPQVIEHTLSKLAMGESLKQIGYQLPLNRNATQYFQLQRFDLADILLQFLFPEESDGLAAFLSESGKFWQEFQHHDGLWFFTGKFERNQSKPMDKSGLIWQLNSFTLLQTPTVWYNPENGQHEILAQDTSYQLYLISRDGKILMQKPIGEKILGKIQTVDLYRNGKKQWLFNTESKIHLIDRLGNPVLGYPMRIPARATAPLCLEDWVKKTVMMVPCSNGKIYGYEMNGKPLKGWSPCEANAITSIPLISGRDAGGQLWLAQLSDNGSFQAWDSTGQPLFPEVSTQHLHPVSLLHLLEGQDPYWIFGGGEQVFQVSRSGELRTWETADSNAHLCALAIDGQLNFYLANPKQIRKYNPGWGYEDGISVDPPELSKLDTIGFQNQSYLITTNAGNGFISLLHPNLKTQIVKNFPVKGPYLVHAQLLPGQLLLLYSENNTLKAFRLR